MQRVATAPPAARRDLFTETAGAMGVRPGIIEKDFWVCWMLGFLFSPEGWPERLLFKGGTSLSKAFHAIERFSEDIDLLIKLEGITEADLMAIRSKKFRKKVYGLTEVFIKDEAFPRIREFVGKLGGVRLEQGRGPFSDILLEYPLSLDAAEYEDSYVEPVVKLEIGPRGTWTPSAAYPITSYAAQHYPAPFGESPACEVPTLEAAVSFWEKATILHTTAQLQPGDEQKPRYHRYSRHYYDVHRLCATAHKQRALENVDLLAQVVAIRVGFFTPKSAYSSITPASLRLQPPDHVRKMLEADYRDMQDMLFGERPSFDAILKTISELEADVNALTA